MQFVVPMMNESFLTQLSIDVVANFKYATIDAIADNFRQVLYFYFWENMQFDEKLQI